MKIRNILFIYLFAQSCISLAMAPKINWDKEVQKAVSKYGFRTESKLRSLFAKQQTSFPPTEISLLAFKKEQIIELWARENSKAWKKINTYPLTAISGHLGPKLRENDLQIPEGVYHLTQFNPFSSFHLSLMVDYPNSFDTQHAITDKRKKLGNEIFLHGKDASVGCLAVGDKAIDELFMLAYRVGLQNIKLVIAPNDLRRNKALTNLQSEPKWVPSLYKIIRRELKSYV